MRTKFGIAAIVAVVLAVASVALASADSPERSADDDSVEVIKLFATEVQSADIDLGAQGFSLGDQFVFSDDLFRRKGGEKLGFDGVVCSVVRIDQQAQSTTVQCTFTASLREGQIAGQGLLTFTEGQGPATNVLPITGGTGEFKNARGEVRVEELSDTEANLTLFVLGGSEDD
jgi:hypothetical protein